MEGLPKRSLILSRSVSKHGRHRQFLFLIGRFLKIFFPEHFSDLKMIVKYYLLRLKISLRFCYVHVSTLIKEIGSCYHVQKLEAQWAEPVSVDI
jgi:hypothetical protein